MNTRKPKTEYYLDMADVISSRGTCIRRNYGAIIVKNDRVIATGYTGAPRGCKNCSDIGTCRRQELNVPSGQRYELCRSVHAEQNAIIQANGMETIGATIYIVGRDANTHELVDGYPCLLCRRMIINAGIERVILRMSDGTAKAISVQDFIDEDNVPNE